MKITFEFATQDDCLDRMVPSDLRVLVAQRDRLQARVAAQQSALNLICTCSWGAAEFFDVGKAASWMQKIAYDALDEVPSTEAFILRKQAEAVQASRQALEGEAVDVERIADTVRDHLGDIFACTRVWEAWQVGTMTEGDFTPAGETELADDIAGAVATLYTHPVSADQWIKCSERLPNEGDCVDAWGSIIGGHHHGDESRICDCFFDHDGGRWWTWNYNCNARIYLDGLNVSHWTPLQEPPKQEQGQ